MKVKIVEVTAYIADDGAEFDSVYALVDYELRKHIQNATERLTNKDAVIDYIVYNWCLINFVRTDIVNTIKLQEEKAIQNHKKLQGVL